MDIEESSFCRLCADLTPNSKLFNLLSDAARCREVVEKLTILKHDFINIFRDQTLPKNVCFLCLDSLYRAVAFVERVEASQATLKDIYSPPTAGDNWPVYDEAITDPFEVGENVKPESISNQKEDSANVAVVAPYTQNLTQSAPNRGEQNNLISYPTTNVSETANQINPLMQYHLNANSTGNQNQECNINYEGESSIANMTPIQTNITKENCQNTITNQYQEEYIRKYEQHIKLTKSITRKLPGKRKKKPLPLPVSELSKILDKSWTGYPWTCDVCFAGFYNVYLLREHTKAVHMRCFAMKCVDCLETTDCYVSFVYHVRSHRPFMKDHCPYCNCRFDKSNQKEHIRMHFNGPEKMCDCCGQTFPNAEELQKHLGIFKPPTPKRLASIARLRPTIIDDKTCSVCNKVFTTAGSARAHKLIHSERKKEHICEVCGKDFFRKSDLSHHRLIHNTADPYVCKICKKTFATLQRLRNHVLTHTAEKPFQCSVCKRNFRLKRQMKDHMIIHTGEKPFECNYCGRKFRFKTTLKSHQLQHTGEKPFVCQNCGREFANWSNCNQHMKTKHGTTLAKHVVTPEGKVPLNPLTGRVKKVKPFEAVKEWTEQILEPPKRKKAQIRVVK
ncbi:unnamed protein product [Plutella xylostella]|uniref:(diamondback moth) hypothetical protein n=1 Tax=Plutella xylostella TaxID=51655 RepID=A0A8S4FZJ8_PLUXY|nr:unnamed protein product [Plutella xylostella]